MGKYAAKHRTKKLSAKKFFLYAAIVLGLSLLIFYLLSTFTTLFGDRDVLDGIIDNPGSETANAVDWEGIYENEAGTVVIRAESESVLLFQIQVSGGSLTAYADVEGSAASYSEDSYSFSMALNGVKLTLDEDGNNPYTATGAGFSGEFSRTGGDPYAVELDTGRGLPDTITELLLDGRIVSVYTDPDGRYTAYFPCLFTVAPVNSQPGDGVYLENDEGTVHITVSAISQGSQTQEALASYLEASYGGSAILRDDGSVLLERPVTDGNGVTWTEVICVMNTNGLLITLNYVFIQSEYDYYAGFYSLLGIGMS